MCATPRHTVRLLRQHFCFPWSMASTRNLEQLNSWRKKEHYYDNFAEMTASGLDQSETTLNINLRLWFNDSVILLWPVVALTNTVGKPVRSQQNNIISFLIHKNVSIKMTNVRYFSTCFLVDINRLQFLPFPIADLYLIYVLPNLEHIKNTIWRSTN